MKPREQALLLLRKAAQDEALLDEVLPSEHVSEAMSTISGRSAGDDSFKELTRSFRHPNTKAVQSLRNRYWVRRRPRQWATLLGIPVGA